MQSFIPYLGVSSRSSALYLSPILSFSPTFSLFLSLVTTLSLSTFISRSFSSFLSLSISLLLFTHSPCSLSLLFNLLFSIFLSKSTTLHLSLPLSLLILVAYDLRRHQGTLLRRWRSPFTRVDLSYFFIVSFSTRTCLSGSSFISLSLLGFLVGSSLFGFLFVKPFFLKNLLIFMNMFRLWVVGLKWALSPLGPFWAL